jgi:hypothetical protein
MAYISASVCSQTDRGKIVAGRATRTGAHLGPASAPDRVPRSNSTEDRQPAAGWPSSSCGAGRNGRADRDKALGTTTEKVIAEQALQTTAV